MFTIHDIRVQCTLCTYRALHDILNVNTCVYKPRIAVPGSAWLSHWTHFSCWGFRCTCSTVTPSCPPCRTWRRNAAPCCVRGVPRTRCWGSSTCGHRDCRPIGSWPIVLDRFSCTFEIYWTRCPFRRELCNRRADCDGDTK